MAHISPIAADISAGSQHRQRRRLPLLVLVLVLMGGIYLSLPRSWFEIPDERPSAARPSPAPVSPAAQPSIEMLQQAVQRSPLDFAARSRYGMALAAAGKHGEAEEEFGAARRLAPQEPVVYHNLGIFYLNRGVLDRADAAFSRQLELTPGDPRAHYYRGLVAQRRLQTDAAIAHFRYGVAVAPDFADGYLALAIEATRKEPEAHIRKYVDRYVELTANRGMGDYVLSGAYRTWGRYDEAARYGEKSIEAEPKNYAYWHNLGQVYSYGKRTQDAERALGEALKLARDPTTVLIELGMNAQAAHRYSDAVTYFRRALDASPRTGNIHSYLSRAYRFMGDEAASHRELQAFRQWERAVRLHKKPSE